MPCSRVVTEKGGPRSDNGILFLVGEDSDSRAVVDTDHFALQPFLNVRILLGDDARQ